MRVLRPALMVALLLAAPAFDAVGSDPFQPLRGGEIYFDFDQDAPRMDQEAKLQQVVDLVQKYSFRIKVVGHADSVGTIAYNQALSERRARALGDLLVLRGVPPDRLLEPMTFGELAPISPDTGPDGSDDPRGRARNRRADLSLLDVR